MSPLFVVLLVVAATVTTASPCNDLETTEAENAFKNCVESAQAGIVTKASEQKDQAQLCEALENMLSGCKTQKELLAECKGVSHAEKIKALHLSVTADIISALNHRVNVEQCSVFTKKTAIPAHRQHHKKHHKGHNQHNVHHERSSGNEDNHLRAEAKVSAAAGASNVVASVWLLVLSARWLLV